ncbi:Putative RNA-binding protein EEED8.10, partial [Ooceraea biroi]
PETVDGVPIRKLFVSNLAERTTFKDLRKCFLTYGNVESCYLRRNQGKSNYAFVTFATVSDAMAALQDGSRKQIRLHNRDLRVMPADSWHQPDSIEQKFYMRKERNRASDRPASEQYSQGCLQNDSENVSIHMLNDDCLRHIFLFLPIADRVRIERVCTRWRILSQDSWHMMRALDLSPFTWGLATHTIHTAKLRKLLLKCGRFLTRINLSDSIHCLSQSTLTIIAKFCPNLTSIDVTALTVCSSGIEALAHNCNNITRFSLGPSTYCCDNELKNFFSRNKGLEYLAISRNSLLGKSLSGLPAETVHTVILERCDLIQDVHLSLALKKLQSLEHLAINDCIGVAERTLETIGEHCKSLRVLELRGDFPFTQTSDMLYLTRLVGLQILKITYNPKMSDEFLASLVQRCQQLVCLDITCCRNVTDDGLTAVATLTKLERMTISYLDRITDSGLQDICGLKELECRNCPFIGDHGVSMLIESSPQLRLLDLSGCHDITSTVFHVAKDACNSRSNNVMLKLIIGGTSIMPKHETDDDDDDVDDDKDDKLSPLLQIVNVDLSDRRICTAMYTDDDDDDDDEDDDDDDDEDEDDDYFDYDDDDDAVYWLGDDSDNSEVLYCESFNIYPPLQRFYF